MEAEIDLPGLVLVPLKTVTRWQPRLNWSKGWVTELVVGGRLIGHGELVMIEDHLGVRVTELFSTPPAA